MGEKSWKEGGIRHRENFGECSDNKTVYAVYARAVYARVHSRALYTAGRIRPPAVYARLYTPVAVMLSLTTCQPT